MLKTLVVAALAVVGAGATAFSGPESVMPTAQDGAVLNRLAANRLAANRLATNRLATNRLAANRLAANRLAANGLPLDGLSLTPTSAGDVTPLVAVVAVTLADGTRLEVPLAR